MSPPLILTRREYLLGHTRAGSSRLSGGMEVKLIPMEVKLIPMGKDGWGIMLGGSTFGPSTLEHAVREALRMVPLEGMEPECRIVARAAGLIQ